MINQAPALCSRVLLPSERMPSPCVILLLVVLMCAVARADVVDDKPLGTPNYGRVSKTGCLAWINSSRPASPDWHLEQWPYDRPDCERGPTMAVRGSIRTNASSVQTDISAAPDTDRGTQEERVREALRNAKRIARELQGPTSDDFISHPVGGL